jgi:hypothetical protein
MSRHLSLATIGVVVILAVLLSRTLRQQTVNSSGSGSSNDNDVVRMVSSGGLQFPVINIASLMASRGDYNVDIGARKAAIGEAIRDACMTHGFFFVVGHGIDQVVFIDTCHRCHQQAHERQVTDPYMLCYVDSKCNMI